jgi:hypothetical protein
LGQNVKFEKESEGAGIELGGGGGGGFRDVLVFY